MALSVEVGDYVVIEELGKQFRQVLKVDQTYGGKTYIIVKDNKGNKVQFAYSSCSRHVSYKNSLCSKCNGSGDIGFTISMRCNVCSGTGLKIK